MHLEWLQAFQQQLIIFQFTVHLGGFLLQKNGVCEGPVRVLTLSLGWRRKSLPSYCRVLTTRSRETVFWQPGCAHTRMTWSWPMRTSCSSCQVRSPLFVLFVFQVVSDLDPGELRHSYCLWLLHASQPHLGCNCFLTHDMACAGQLRFVHCDKKLDCLFGLFPDT